MTGGGHTLHTTSNPSSISIHSSCLYFLEVSVSVQPLLLIYHAFNLSQQWTTDTQTACHKESNNSSVGLHSGFRTRFLSNRFGNCSAIISGISPSSKKCTVRRPLDIGNVHGGRALNRFLNKLNALKRPQTVPVSPPTKLSRQPLTSQPRHFNACQG